MKRWKKALVVLVTLAVLAGAVVSVHAAEEEEYTDTLQRDCMLAVRADVFDGFTGTVEVSVLDGDMNVVECELTAQNGYAYNLWTVQGSCEIKAARAYAGDIFYEVKRLESGIRAVPGEVAVCRLVVSRYEMPREEKTEVQETEGVRQSMEETMGKHYENIQGSTGKRKAHGGRISVILWLTALLGAGVYWYLHYGRKNRHGR